jgi:Holliday junction resolvase RusA-like endonuclease
MISFFVPYEVKPKGNRKQIYRTKDGRSLIGQPDAHRQNEQNLIALFAKYAPAKPLEGPVEVAYCFQYPWRTNHSKKVRAKGWIPKDKSPDLGQLTKRCDDVLQACGFVSNDSQIASYAGTEKVYCDRGGVRVEIRSMDAQ